MMTISKKTEPNRPSHRVYAVTRSGEKNYWREIGAVWGHADGDGFNVKLDLLPLNGAEIVIRKPLPPAEAEAAIDAAND